VDKSITRDAPESFPKKFVTTSPFRVAKAVTYVTNRDGPECVKSDSVRSGSRQYEYYFGGELTASDLTLDAVRM
jgi:hypothetical protein